MKSLKLQLGKPENKEKTQKNKLIKKDTIFHAIFFLNKSKIHKFYSINEEKNEM